MHCFSSLSAARAAVAKKGDGGYVLAGPKPFEETMDGCDPDEYAAYDVVGSPVKVWIICSGDSGCVNAYSGAYLDKASAEAGAVKDQARFPDWTFCVYEVDVEK